MFQHSIKEKSAAIRGNSYSRPSITLPEARSNRRLSRGIYSIQGTPWNHLRSCQYQSHNIPSKPRFPSEYISPHLWASSARFSNRLSSVTKCVRLSILNYTPHYFVQYEHVLMWLLVDHHDHSTSQSVFVSNRCTLPHLFNCRYQTPSLLFILGKKDYSQTPLSLDSNAAVVSKQGKGGEQSDKKIVYRYWISSPACTWSSNPE